MSTHACAVGHVMAGQVIDGVFYCAHGVALGTPEPQHHSPVAIEWSVPPYGWCPSLDAPIVDSDGRRAHEWVAEAALCDPHLTRHCIHCAATVSEPIPVSEEERFLYEQGQI